MIKYLFLIAFQFFAWQVPLYSYSQSLFKYDIEKITADVYVLKPVINEYRWVTANIVVIVGEDDIVVVDSGLLPDAAREAIREIRKISNKPVRQLLNTHWHGDHWQGNEVFAKEFPGLQIISTEKNSEAIKRSGMVWINNFYPKYLQQMIDGYEMEIKNNKPAGSDKNFNANELELIKEGVGQVKEDLANMKKINPVFPNVIFNDKMIIKKGQRIFEFYYLGVGNTVGDAVLYLPNEKILIPGDLVVYPSPYESGAFSKEWVETSKKLKQFDFNYLVPGHGDVQHNTGYLDYLNDLYAELFRQMNDAYLRGKATIEEVQKMVTTESVTKELNKNPKYVYFTKNLGNDFVPNAIRDSYRRLSIGIY
ncbi:MAG: MBL fold metallo-hydrolase [Bacteroidetes bacterium]|nr:MBL fold metallo-hydrolase [Bacteroidota bacterium]